MSGTTSASTPAEMRALILEAESLLFARLDATADPAERQSLAGQIDELNVQKDTLTASLASGQAATLNELSDVLAAALANVRTQPFNGIGGKIEGLLERIGGALGSGQQRAEAPLLEVDPPPSRQPRKPSAGKTTAVIATAAGSGTAPKFASEYRTLFDSCSIRPEHEADVRANVSRLVAGASVYQKISDAAGGRISWPFIGITHGLECSFSFEKHLHNGDPLTARTVHVPAGRPKTGSPPFSFQESALDAIQLEGLDTVDNWTLADMLFRWEKFNGFGYRRPDINIHTPYLWSFSNHYERGKFVGDGVFDASAVSRQCGAAVMLKGLVLGGVVALDGVATRRQPAAAAPPPASAAVLGAGAAALLPTGSLPRHVSAEVEFPGEIGPGSKNAAAARRVQEWCTFHGPATGIDGDYGSGTEGAVRDLQTRRGIPATGVVDARTWAALTAPMLRALADVKPGGPGLHGMVTAVAAQHLAQHPVEVGGDNKGPWVRLYMDGKDGEAQQWCAGFLCFVVQQAALRTQTEMPFRRQVGCDALVADAKRDGRFVAGDDLRTPAARISRLPPGTIFAIRKADDPADYIHAGLVSEAGGDRYRTVEGNTNQTGSERGFEVTENSRRYQNVDFLLLS